LFRIETISCRAVYKGSIQSCSADYFTRPELPADYQQPTVVAPKVGSGNGLERVGPEGEGSTRARR
jgi:hypothetical protein